MRRTKCLRRTRSHPDQVRGSREDADYAREGEVAGPRGTAGRAEEADVACIHAPDRKTSASQPCPQRVPIRYQPREIFVRARYRPHMTVEFRILGPIEASGGNG